MTEPGRVELRLLGRFAALRDGVEIPPAAFAGRKVRTLVKVLATRQGSFVSNDSLAEALWPGRLPSDPVANLQVLVNRARRALGDSSIILTGQGGYTLAGPPLCTVDAERFLAAPDLSLWQGEPLPEEAYDDWAVDYRAQLFRARQQVLEQAATSALDEGDADAAVDLASRAVEAEPLREVAVLLLVGALEAAGDGAAALTAYDDYRRALADELGVDPSPEAVAVHQRLLQRTPPPSAGRRRRARGFSELTFVGRDQELAALRKALQRPGSLVTVSGSSGAGKSRLVDRVSQEVPLLRARAYLPERSEPWTLLRTVLREVVAQDITYVDTLPGPMVAALSWLLPELDRPTGADPDPESRRILLHEAALRLLETAGAVVAVDDLQWCDPSSLGVLEAARARIADLTVVFAYRPEEVGERDDVRELLGRSDAALRVHLGALDDGALHQLVDDEAVVAVLREHTDRTPMAVAEVLRALAGEGLAVASPDGRWQADPGAAERAVALARDGQHAAIVTRVAGQAVPDRELLALLSLLARETRVATLAAATGSSEPEVLEALSRLFRQGLVRLGDEGWATSHDMVTEVVAAGLDDAERARLHAAVADALRADGDPLLLAHHLRESGDTPGAADAFALAAQRAFDTFATEEAEHLADVGLGLSPAAPVGALLHELRGQARHRRGDFAGAREDLRAALAVHAGGPVRARLLARLAMLSSGSDDIVRAAQLAELAVVEAGEDAPVRARALEVASVLDMNLERGDRAAARASEALALYERLGDANGMARILDAQAMAQFLDGDVRGGEAALRRAADLFEDSGDLVRVVTPRSTSGHALVFAGDPSAGLARVTDALELARTLGDPEGQSYTLWHRAEALAALGQGEEAAVEAGEALTIAQRIGHRGWTATAWRAVGLAAQAQGELDDALHAFHSSLELSEHLGLFASWAAARTALVLAASGAAAEAVPFVERALAEGPPLGHYEARWAQVEVAAALGDPAAPALAQSALERLDAGGVHQGRTSLISMIAPD